MAVARYDAAADSDAPGCRDPYDVRPAGTPGGRLTDPAGGPGGLDPARGHGRAARESAPPADRARTAPGAARHPAVPAVACIGAPR